MINDVHTVIPHVPVVIRLGVVSSILAKPSGQGFLYFVFAKRVRSSAFSPICNAKTSKQDGFACFGKSACQRMV